MLKTAVLEHRASGFSIVELMFTIAVLAILLGLAMPSFGTWLKNLQVKNAAQSITSGIQRARAEAVSRNMNVSFALGAGSSWTVNIVSTAEVVESKPSTEGAEDVTMVIAPGGASMLTFGNLGVVIANADGTPPLSQIDFSAVGSDRNMRVTIGIGGNARMCDPNQPTGSSLSAC